MVGGLLDNFSQSHFQLYELILPYCTVCTPVAGVSGKWHTPVTCIEPSDSEYSIWFGHGDLTLTARPLSQSIGIPSALNGTIFRCVTNYSESTAKLKGEGLASRGTISLTCADFAGDPAPINTSNNGTFFGKLRARNILVGKKIKTHYCTIVNDKIQKVAETVHYVTSTELSGGVFRLSAKDALKDIEQFSQEFPAPSEITLLSDIDETATRFQVSAAGLLVGDVVCIGDELMKIKSIDALWIETEVRGATMVSGDGTVIYKTDASSHSAGDTVQWCYVMDKKPIYDALRDILNGVDMSEFVNYSQWKTEVDEWTADAFLYGVFTEPTAADEQIDSILKAYLIDGWLDQSTQKLKLSAVTAWKESTRIIKEEADFQDLSIKDSEDSRFTRAYITCLKDYQAKSDDAENYRKIVMSTDLQQEVSDFYGSIKLKDMGMIPFITANSAQTSTSRYIQRYSKSPKVLTFKIEENRLAGLQLSDVIDVIARDSQDAAGQTVESKIRAQISRIQPDFGSIGRRYNIECLSYVPVLSLEEGAEIEFIVSGNVYDLNLFSRAGAPNVPVRATFIFDAAVVGSSSVDSPSVRAGAFKEGSTIKILCTNNSSWSAKGGDSSVVRQSGRSVYIDVQPEDGGVAYQSDGVKTDIYLNYIHESTVCTGSLIAAGGGGGCGFGYVMLHDSGGYVFDDHDSFALIGGGNGIPSGRGGIFISVNGTVEAESGGIDKAGESVTLSRGRRYIGDNFVESYASITDSIIGGKGGSSGASSGVGGFSINWDESYVVYTGNRLGGEAGAAIKGSGVTVYNNNSGRLVSGDSDYFVVVG